MRHHLLTSVGRLSRRLSACSETRCTVDALYFVTSFVWGDSIQDYKTTWAIHLTVKVWHDYDSAHHSCFTAHEICRKSIPPKRSCISSRCHRSADTWVTVWNMIQHVNCYILLLFFRGVIRPLILFSRNMRSRMTRTKSHKCVVLQLKHVNR